MGTPFKNFFLSSPKIFTPVSPRSLSNLQKSVNKSDRVTANFKTSGRVCANVSRKLFTDENKSSAWKAFEDVKISITDFDVKKNTLAVSNDVLFNTPNKCELLENGIEGKRLINIIGRGTFGTVIRGIHKGSTVAIKVIANKRHSYINERNALSLDHENIVKTIDVVISTTLNYSIVLMEYYPDCMQLQEILDGDDFIPEEKKIKYAIDVCNGLSYCHENNLLHLDVKPKNILVSQDCCKLCDFGNSLLLENIENFSNQGTIMYTDPCILLGKLPTKKSDVYSFGIILWQMKFRKQPYENIDNNETIIYKVVKCNLRPSFNKEDCEYCRLFCRCWDSHEKERPDIGTVLQLLKKIYHSVRLC